MDDANPGQLALTVRMVDLTDPPQGPLGTVPPYVLDGGESLRATFRGQTTTLQPFAAYMDAPGNYYAYITPDGNVAADEPLDVTFDRGGEQVTFGITTTADFVLSAPASSPQPVTVTWTPATADAMSWQAFTCDAIEADGPIPHDAGRIDFPAGVLDLPMPSTACLAMIEFSRTRGGFPETALHDTSVRFTRSHDVSLEVTP